MSACVESIAFVQKALEHGPCCYTDPARLCGLSQAQHDHIRWKEHQIEKDIDAWDLGWPSSLPSHGTDNFAEHTRWDDTVNQMYDLASSFDEFPERKGNWVYWLQVLEAIDDTPDGPVA